MTLVFLGCCAAFVVAGETVYSQKSLAYAVTEITDGEVSAAQQAVEDSAKAYEDATAKLKDLDNRVKENTAKLKEIQEALPAQRDASAAALREQYKLDAQGFSLLDLILGAENLGDFIRNYDYFDHLQQKNLAEINRLTELSAELEKTQESLKADRAEAAKVQESAAQALEQAKAARAAAQEAARKAAEEEAAAEAAEEEAAAEAAAAAAAKDEPAADDSKSGSGSISGNVSDKKKSDDSADKQDGKKTSPKKSEPKLTGPSADGADWSADKKAFVNEWSGRIDSYLSGSPLAGQGKTFAEAAWNYGVDPRWSPAISCIESGKGETCFLPHNAWGWGSASWGSWKEAINDHVAGLARIYGYTISKEGAKMYCPPNWKNWYNNVSSEMNRI